MKIYAALILLLLNIQLYGQDNKFGKVLKEVLEKTVSDIDPDTDAEILYKNENISYVFNQQTGFTQRRNIHVRIKIYTKEGLDWANYSVLLYDSGGADRTHLSNLRGYTYNLVEGKVEKTKLNKESAFKKDVAEFTKEVSVAFPNVKEGSVIEIKYELEMPFIGIGEVNVQELIPIKKLVVKVSIPEYFNFKTTVNPKAAFYPKLIKSTKRRKENISSKIRSETSSSTQTKYYNSNLEFIEHITTVDLENVLPLKEENYVDNLKNYIAKVIWEYSFFKGPNGKITDYSSSWEDVSKTIYGSSSFGGQLKKTAYFKDDLEAVVAGINDPIAKTNAVFNFVKSKMKWNEYYGKYTSDGVKKAYKNGVGNVAEINLMLTAMLRYAGLNANPVLVSTKSNGIPIIATLDGFNYVISAIELENKTILLDASSRYALPDVLPLRVLNWQGRLIRKNESSIWTSLQQKNSILDYKIIYYKITDNLEVEGKIRESKTLQLAQITRQNEAKLSMEDKIEALEDHPIDITVKNLVLKNKDDYTKPYVKSFDFSSDELIEEIGGKIYIAPLLFYTVEESPFKEETRTYPIDFKYPFSNKYIINITIPEGYELDYLPESSANQFLEENISSYSYQAELNGQIITLNITYDFNASFVFVNQYKSFRHYFNTYLEKVSDKIVLKRK